MTDYPEIKTDHWNLVPMACSLYVLMRDISESLHCLLSVNIKQDAKGSTKIRVYGVV